MDEQEKVTADKGYYKEKPFCAEIYNGKTLNQAFEDQTSNEVNIHIAQTSSHEVDKICQTSNEEVIDETQDDNNKASWIRPNLDFQRFVHFYNINRSERIWIRHFKCFIS